eukprot:9897836-Alexandrium_andersonii.AAC.1
MFLFKDDVWYLQLGRGAVVNVAGAGETAVVPMLADSGVRLQGPAAQRPTNSWYTTRSVHLRVEGVAQTWANGCHARPEAAAATVHIDPPDDGCLAEVESL